MAEQKNYDADSIKILEGLEGVRRRPAMYIGGTGKDGLHHLVYEIVDNSVDEALAGFCKVINVVLNKDGSVTVVDDGRGIPVDINKIHKKSALEIVFTKLHAGGKFDKDSYKISGGLHGVGASVVNALSSKLVVNVKRDGKIYEQIYKNGGKPVDNVKPIGKYNEKEGTGTRVTFWPDSEIFSTLNFDFAVLKKRLQEIAFLNAGLKITLEEEASKKKEEFYYAGGLIEFIQHITHNKSPLHKPIYFKKESGTTVVEVAIQYTDSFNENIFGFVNTINTTEGGTHISGFKSGLTGVINDYAKKKGLLKEVDIDGDDTREGITSIVSLKLADPQFEGQTKTKLGNSEIKGLIDSMTTVALGEYFEQNPVVVNKIVQKIIAAAKAREAAKKARDLVRRKNALGFGGGLPGKLADCSSKKFEKTELFICEGDSAAGCFSGDTKVALVDGRNLSFKQLVEEDKNGKKNFCYTIKEDGTMGMEKIESPRITKQDAEVIKITLNNNQEIICTPNHKFMLRNGCYKEAKDLTIEDSLMPLNRKISKIGGRITIEGYEMVWDNKKKLWIFTHLLSDDYNIKNSVYPKEQGDARHHIDFNKRNNNPNNLIRMPKDEHFILHTEKLEKTIHRPDIKEKAAKAHQTKEYIEKMQNWAKNPKVREVMSKNSKKLWQNQNYKNFMAKKFLDFYNSNEDYRRKNNELLNEQQKIYWNSQENKRKQAERVRKFFEMHQEAREFLSSLAKEQWKDEALIIWRRQKTREQWTPEFRTKYKQARNKVFYDATIKAMKTTLEKQGNLDNFNIFRKSLKNKCILKKDSFCSKFFNSDDDKMLEAVKNYNHKIKKIESLKDRINVYDIEVPNTHNFALASGVFVHNSSKSARDKEFQAILPLRGKILNVEKANPVKALSSEEVANIITAVGTGIKENFDKEKLRYNKIILMCDADVDGQHITTLLLTFFFRYTPQLIENGNVFIAVSPLFRLRKGKDVYVYTEAEKEKKLKELGGKADIQRFKGLGEMNPEQLWETTMNPKTRILKKVTIEDAVEADKTFSMLMGDEVGPRREFIQKNAHIAELDL
jgi:DNA gyrase subunit B